MDEEISMVGCYKERMKRSEVNTLRDEKRSLKAHRKRTGPVEKKNADNEYLGLCRTELR